MVRSLYRFYLYSVCSALLIFALTAFGTLISTLASFTPLRGQYSSAPGQAQLVQSISFACIAFLISGVLGGLHYWLLRRDMKQDEQAYNSPIRAFFLHTLQGIGVVIGVPLLGTTFAILGTSASPNVSSLLASALSFLLLAVLVALESRRTKELSGVALVFQRIHFFGTQVVLLLTMIVFFFLLRYVRRLIDLWFFGGLTQNTYCYQCSVGNSIWLAIALVWVAGAWIWYGWMTYQDRSLATRLIFHGLGLAFGAAAFLDGIWLVLTWLFRMLSGEQIGVEHIIGSSGDLDFFSSLILGCIVLAVYLWLLRGTVRQQLLQARQLGLTVVAIVGGIAAAFFWVGAGRLLYDGLQTWFPITTRPDRIEWLTSLALAVTGVGYIALDWFLRRQYRSNGELALGPRRGFVLVLLGAGVITGAIGLAMALYVGITASLGSAANNWQQMVQGGLATLIIGLVLVGIYLLPALREHLFKGREHSAKAEVPRIEVGAENKGAHEEPVAEEQVSLQLTTVEEILDALLELKITRGEAASRLHALMDAPKSE
ncbi:hypothetical protein [Ktedonospora formicarum]|uniref:DUF5671 domain-containing protein n=1 Tax=Ktedonospora formicarum TaxID=2778364 RepID=A0A8J3MQD0_9CHLR|nr:hypothetical protein [Ktedonospora formicarum]GHO42626.1 hypothetical protein KSX_07890 [Ktedonospora formicarum]